ncbi:hypothetical protein M407DRAFT_11567 [Tulasnella calospora MUT 4182]|uniref:Uncharacterized protein n=1 Tax=Tulasnella calospora MUT 4182 TaxID=1051891 RepID=A0A0C3Q6U0_9AGAM|nr:hypothetical protein M407DRAFT_11567 [Tulasnella calospora MUT 4182]
MLGTVFSSSVIPATRARIVAAGSELGGFLLVGHSMLQRVLLKLAPYLPSTPIMQKLTSVRFEMTWKLEVDLELLGHFLPTSVTEVDVWASQLQKGGLGYQRFIAALATERKLPRLSSFSVAIHYQSRIDAGPDVSRVLETYPGIERLSGTLRPHHRLHQVLCLAGQLPCLRHFQMSDCDGMVLTREPEIPSLPYGSFPALESLELSSAPGCLGTLLVRVSSRKIQNIRLMVDAGNRLHEFQDAGGTPLADSFRAIGRLARLKALSVVLGIRTTWEIVHHILGCTELQTLTIVVRHNCDLVLQEGHLEQMGRAWRDLETMRLQLTDSYDSHTKFLELSHLHVIATEFRNLRKLAIKCDARSVSNGGFNVGDQAVAPRNSLEELDVGES